MTQAKCNNEQLKQRIFEIRQFMMECHNFEFSASQLFTIDLRVIVSLISAITTYLVVLIQFQFIEEQFMKQSSLTDDDYDVIFKKTERIF